jgi:SAM-dependent methyltransferase
MAAPAQTCGVGSAFNSVAELVNLYDGAYRNYIVDTYQQVRVETYGADLGQTSWVTKEESAEIPRLLELTTDSVVLEIGCGSGAYALHIAANVACRIVGLDINASGIQNANELARARRLDGRASFKQCDVSLNWRSRGTVSMQCLRTTSCATYRREARCWKKCVRCSNPVV